MSSSSPSPQVVEQRIRNRIIEWLEMISTDSDSSPACGFNEAVNQFYDWTQGLVPKAPVFTIFEASLVGEITLAMEYFCISTPEFIPDEESTWQLPEWQKLQSISAKALDNFRIRGMLSEIEEI